jgi:hypothetical protein
MVQPFRSALVGLALGSVAFLAVALLDGAFTNFMPSLSRVRIAQTDLATCFVFGELVVAFLFAGYWGKRLRAGLIWLLVPIGALYVSAIANAPYVYGCDLRQHFGGCVFVHAPFVIGIVACCVGFLVRVPTRGAQHVV